MKARDEFILNNTTISVRDVLGHFSLYTYFNYEEIKLSVEGYPINRSDTSEDVSTLIINLIGNYELVKKAWLIHQRNKIIGDILNDN